MKNRNFLVFNRCSTDAKQVFNKCSSTDAKQVFNKCSTDGIQVSKVSKVKKEKMVFFVFWRRQKKLVSACKDPYCPATNLFNKNEMAHPSTIKLNEMARKERGKKKIK